MGEKVVELCKALLATLLSEAHVHLVKSVAWESPCLTATCCNYDEADSLSQVCRRHRSGLAKGRRMHRLRVRVRAPTALICYRRKAGPQH